MGRANCTSATDVTLEGYNRFCASLPRATHVVQWGDADVWKVGGKVFSLARWHADERELYVTFKVSPLGFEIMKEMAGLRPAPYLASRGLKWVQRTSGLSLSDPALKDALRDSHALVVAGLSKTLRRDLGLTAAPPAAPSRRTHRVHS